MDRSRRAVEAGRAAAARLWELRWPLAFSLFLLSPLCYELRLGAPGAWRPDKVLAFALPASILLLLVWQLAIRRLWLAHALAFPLFITVSIDLWTISHYSTRMTASTIGVSLENLHDAGPYLRQHLAPIALALGCLLLVYARGLYQMRALRLHSRPRLLALGAALTLGLYGAAHIQMGGPWFDVANRDRGSPFGFLPQLYTAWAVSSAEREQSARAAGFKFGARQAPARRGPEVYVLVIGESSRPDHWSLFGYRRDTTPRLLAEPALVAFRDVLSPVALTQAAVPLLLTRARLRDVRLPEEFKSGVREGPPAAPERSILSAFSEAGFETWWLSTQQRDQWTGHINRFSSEAGSQRYFDRSYDGVLIEAMREALDAAFAAGKEKLFFVLHTSGSHITYSERTPPLLARYAREPGADRMIGAYDDSIAYTDRVLADAIELLRSRTALAGLLYISDHGENLLDDERRLTTHFHNNEYDLPVPMVLWTSPAWNARWPEKIEAARANADRPLSSEVVFHTLADLAGITMRDDRRQHLSVLRATLDPPPREVACASGVCEFERTGLAPRLSALRDARAREAALLLHRAEAVHDLAPASR